VELFNAYVNILSKCTVEPVYKNGKPDIPNIIDGRPGGGTVLPIPYEVRFVERT
jgi:hypothetical protein